jgi:hypothetical protein
MSAHTIPRAPARPEHAPDTRRGAGRGGRLLVGALLSVVLVGGAGACSEGDDEPSVASADSDGSSETTDTTAPAPTDASAFADCMRDQGIAVGDPDPVTGIPEIPDDVDPAGEAYQSAMDACQDLLPEGGLRGDAAGEGPTTEQLQDFAECMRQNGLPDFPDPQPGSDTAFGDLDRQSPAFQEAAQACQDTLG